MQILEKSRSSGSQMFFKIYVLKNLRNFTGKNLSWCLILIKLQALKTFFSTEHFQWLLLEGFCEGTSLVKILQSFHFNLYGINHAKASEIRPLRKIINNRDCWNVYRFSCFILIFYVVLCRLILVWAVTH